MTDQGSLKKERDPSWNLAPEDAGLKKCAMHGTNFPLNYNTKKQRPFFRFWALDRYVSLLPPPVSGQATQNRDTGEAEEGFLPIPRLSYHGGKETQFKARENKH